MAGPMRELRCCSRAALLLALLVALASGRRALAPRGGGTSHNRGGRRGELRLRGGSNDDSDAAKPARTVRVGSREAAAIECLKAFTQPDAEREGDDDVINTVRTRARAGGWCTPAPTRRPCAAGLWQWSERQDPNPKPQLLTPKHQLLPPKAKR